MPLNDVEHNALFLGMFSVFVGLMLGLALTISPIFLLLVALNCWMSHGCWVDLRAELAILQREANEGSSPYRE